MVANKELEKINKSKARKLFNEGKTLYFVPCKVFPDFSNNYIKPYEINKDSIKDEVILNNFDSIVNNYEYYSTCYELGYYTHFYTEKSKRYYITIQDELIREKQALNCNFYQYEVLLTDSEKEKLKGLFSFTRNNNNKIYECLLNCLVHKKDKIIVNKLIKDIDK